MIMACGLAVGYKGARFVHGNSLDCICAAKARSLAVNPPTVTH